MKHHIQNQLGFNIIELFITLGVLVAFASIAYPAYKDYMRRDYYGEILQVTMPYKVAIGKCYEDTKKLTFCNGGKRGIPNNILTPKDKIASLTVKSGVISIVPVKDRGILSTDNYILTPSIINKTLTWMPSGAAVKKGYVDP